MPYEFYQSTSSNDDIEERIAEQKRRTSEAREKIRKPKPALHTLPRQAWSCANTADYFVSEMEMKWGINHFTVVKSRFVPALAGKRKTFNTDGEIEARMVDLFFESLQHDRYSNGEMLWKGFIKRFAEFEQLARASIVSPEEEAAAQAVADKSWSWVEQE